MIEYDVISVEVFYKARTRLEPYGSFQASIWIVSVWIT